MNTFYFDMDGVIANFHKEKFNFKNASNREWIANLEPFTDNIDLMINLITKGERVYILTKAINDNARLGKIDFIKKYLPMFNIEKYFICIVGNGKKIDFIKQDGMLIDDDMKNLNAWKKANQPIYFVENKGEKVVF